MTTTNTAAAQQRRIYGAGWSWPLRPSAAGQLHRSEGEARLAESIEAILDTPLGARPLDPSYGVSAEVFEPLSDVSAVAWAIAQAIERCEPRIQDIRVEVLGLRPGDGTLLLRLTWRARGALTTTTRTFPFYRLS